MVVAALDQEIVVDSVVPLPMLAVAAADQVTVLAAEAAVVVLLVDQEEVPGQITVAVVMEEKVQVQNTLVQLQL